MGVIYGFGRDCDQFKFPIKSDIFLGELPVTSYLQKKIWFVERFWLISCVRNAVMLQNLSFICFGSAVRLETHGFLCLSSLHHRWFLFGPSLCSYGMFWWMHSGLWKMLALLLLLRGLCGLIEVRWFMASWGRQVCYWLIGVGHTWKSIGLQAIPL